MDYKKIPTTPEVWAVIRIAHPELKPFSSFSDPEGGHELGDRKPRMETSWGFPSADYPLLEARTTWERSSDPKKPWLRENEKHEYWLCLPIKED